jgi:ligand-binding sensor domain-containing protein
MSYHPCTSTRKSVFSFGAKFADGCREEDFDLHVEASEMNKCTSAGKLRACKEISSDFPRLESGQKSEVILLQLLSIRLKGIALLKRMPAALMVTTVFCLMVAVSARQPRFTHAQNSDSFWRTYTTTDGLPFSNISRVFQDKNGDVWVVSAFGYEQASVATITSTLTITGVNQLEELTQLTPGSGVARFDGFNWTAYTNESTHGEMPSDNILAVTADQEGKVWFSFSDNIGHGLGVASFDGEQWQAFTQEDGLAGNLVYAILQAQDGAFWFATSQGVTRYDGEGRWETFRGEDTLGGSVALDVFQADDGVLWFSVSKKGGCLTRYHGNVWEPCLISDLPFDDISQFTQDKADHWWIRSFSGIAGESDQYDIMTPGATVVFYVTQAPVVATYDGQTWHIMDRKNSALPDDYVSSLRRDSGGNIWFGTSNGAARFDGQGWQVFTESLQYVTDIFEDSVDHTIWFATSSGLRSYREDPWHTFTTEDGFMGANVQQLLEDDAGAIWGLVSPIGILSRFKDGTRQVFTAKDGLASNDVTRVFEAKDGTVWVGTAYGLSQYKNGIWQSFPIDRYWGNVSQILETKDGALWVVTDTGLRRYYDRAWQTFGPEDGLIDSDIWQITETRDGTLWAGTGTGLSCYKDGAWQTYTTKDGLASNRIWPLLEAGDGALWVGTDNGLSRYKDGSWQTFTAKDGLASNQIWSLLEAGDGALWVGTDNGLSRYKDGSWQAFTTKDGLASNRIWRLLEAGDGALWVGTDTGLSRYEDGSWQTFTTKDGLADNTVQRLVEDKNGVIWVGTNRGLSCYQHEKWQPPAIESGPGNISNRQVSYLLATKDGALWVISEAPSLQRYQNGAWQAITTEEEVVSDFVYNLYKTSNGAIWVATSKGLSRYYESKWQTYSSENGLAGDYVGSLLEASDGTIWVTTGNGLSRYQDGKWRSFTAEAGDLASNAVDKITETNDGAIWVSYLYDYETNKGFGLSRYYEGQWQMFTSRNGLPSDNVREIIGARDGALWVVTDGGLSRYYEGTWQMFTAEAGDLSSNEVDEIVETADGTVWVSYGYDIDYSRSFGISRYREGQWQSFTAETGNFSDNYIFHLLGTEDGALWATVWYGGVIRYQGGQWENFTVASGSIPSNYVSRLLKTEDGSVWVITDKGISRFKEGIWQTFDTEVHLASDKISTAVSTSGGVIWINTSEGLIRYRPGGRPPRIKNLTINDRLPVDNVVALSYNDRRPVIQFEGADLVTPTKRIRYLYRLDSLDNWYIADSNTISYPPLAPGQHTFWLKAIDEEGNISKPVKVDVIVSPFEITPYAYSVAGLGAIVVAVVVYTRQRAQRRTRRAIARKENPYVANVPVKDPKLFFGRDDILGQIVNGVDRNNFAVCGPKRIGKTSLLHRLATALEQLDDSPYAFRPVMLSLHGVSEDKFFRTVGRSIARQYRAELDSTSLGNRGSVEIYDTYELLLDLETIQSVLQAASDKPLRLILLIDEGDVLNEYGQATLAQWRYVLMGPALEFLKMVWTGEQLDQRPWKLTGSDWLTVFGHVFYLTSLTEDEAIRLIRDPVPYYRYDQEAVRLILAESQLIPHQIQLLCRAAVEEMLKEGRGRIEVRHVESAIHSQRR